MQVVVPREYTSMPALADPPLFIYSVVIALNVVFWTSTVWLVAAASQFIRRPRVPNI